MSTSKDQPETAAATGAPPRQTRSQTPSITIQTAATTSEEFESIQQQAQEAVRPTRPTGRLTPRQVVERHRDRSHSGGRTPSPRPTTASAFPFTAAMDEDTINRIVAAALKKDREDRDHHQRIATEAAVAAALANQTSQVRALRKPDLPNFDKHNVEQWIRRVEKAYTRNQIVDVIDKFAFLEKIFSVDNDPQINEFLDGRTTDDWDDFLAYLREQHGRTKEQQTQSVLNGIPREGRRPTKFHAHILERVGKASLDDVLRELMLREIPSEVRRHAAPKIKDMSFKETAKYLDNYFDPTGKLLNASTPTTLNHVGHRQQRPLQPSLKKESNSRHTSASPTRSSESSGFTTAFDDTLEASDVNAVRFKPNGQRQQFQVSNRSQSRGRSRYSSRGNSSRGDSSRGDSNNSNFNNNRSSNNQQRSSSRYGSSNNNSNNNQGASGRSKLRGNVCFYHVNHGKKADNCVEGCMLYSEHKAAKGQASH